MDPCALSGSDARGGAAVSNDAYTGMRNAGAMLDHTRPGVRCFAYRPGATFLRGLIPGYGQAKTWSRIAGGVVAALTVGGALSAYAFSQAANSSYATYQATRSGYAPRFYTEAVSRRSSAKALATATGALWLGAAIEAEVQERIHAARLNVVHEFWFRPIIEAQPAAAGKGLGLGGGLRFDFR